MGARCPTGVLSLPLPPAVERYDQDDSSLSHQVALSPFWTVTGRRWNFKFYILFVVTLKIFENKRTNMQFHLRFYIHPYCYHVVLAGYVLIPTLAHVLLFQCTVLCVEGKYKTVRQFYRFQLLINLVSICHSNPEIIAYISFRSPIPMLKQFMARICGRTLVGIPGSNPAGGRGCLWFVCCTVRTEKAKARTFRKKKYG